MWSQTVKYSMQSTTQRQCCVSKFRRPSPITRMHAGKGKTTEKLTIHIFLCCIFTPYSNPRKNLVRVRNRLCFGFLKKWFCTEVSLKHKASFVCPNRTREV